MNKLSRLSGIIIPALLVAFFAVQATRIAFSAFSLRQEIESAQENILSGDIIFAHEDLKNALDTVSQLEQSLAFFSFLKAVPVVGTQLDAAHVILSAGKSLLSASVSTVSIAQEVVAVLKTDRKNKTVKDISVEQKKEVFQNFFRKAPELKGDQAQITLSLARLSQLNSQKLIFPLNILKDQMEERGASLSHFFEVAAPFLEVGPRMLGFPDAKTYLVLLQNNMEVRGTGGFIGSYAILTLKDADIAHIRTDNVYNLDDRAVNLKIIPPEPFLRYFPPKERWWYLRDSNWSPDFPDSARQAQFFYTREGGREHLDGVMAVTPDVLASVLGIVGPVQTEGRIFTQENFADELEHEVEQGYSRRGIPENQRKEVIGKVLREILKRIYALPSDKFREVFSVLEKNLAEKHILLYFNDAETQSFAVKSRWSGEMIDREEGDYLMVVDGNMGSMKTDSVMEKHIAYSVTEGEDHRLTAHLELTYENNGSFTWKTTRYKDYVRVYVSPGSRLIGSSGFIEKEGSTKPGNIDILPEHGKLGLGGFLVVEPGKKHKVILDYALSQDASENLSNGMYTLFVQKQSGVSNQEFEAHLHFQKRAKAVAPEAIVVKNTGKDIDVVAPLYVDREIKIAF